MSSILPLLSMLVVFALLDGMTQQGHWKLFFGIIGAVVLAVVLVSAAVLSVFGGRVIDRIGKLISVMPASAILVAGLVGMLSFESSRPTFT